MRDAVHGYLTFFHRLQQRRLRLRCRAVYLVGKHHLRKDRSRPELEVTRALVVYRDARHIRRQKVRRELNPVKRAAA